jgi:hypothetical protein
MFKKLNEYLSKWHSIEEEEKPCNEDDFINPFIELLNNADSYSYDLSFDGDGSYFGKQITISFYKKEYHPFCFEVAYSQKNISVYTANHHSYWTPEYVRLTSKDARFEEIKKPLFEFLLQAFGL